MRPPKQGEQVQREQIQGEQAGVDDEWRTWPLLERERALWQAGFQLIAGIDEAGRGPLAGPVVAAACILPRALVFADVRDSKVLSEAARNRIAEELLSRADVIWAIGVVSEQKIDQINILRATLLAMKQAVEALSVMPDMLLVDGRNAPESHLPKFAIIDGDALSQSVAAASIIAKHKRDAIMRECHRAYPHYGFDRHKGYGTAEHLDAIRKHGLCPHHRRAFAPCKLAAERRAADEKEKA
jgi:ribonuclease HII